MIQRIKRLLAVAALAFLFFAPGLALAAPQSALAAADVPQNPADCESRILGIPSWFRGIVKVENNECIIMSPSEVDSKTPAPFIWRIALNVIEIGLFIAGYIAIFFVLYGGFQFLTGGANPGQTEKARMTILNAVIGLAISMAAIAAVNLIFRIING